VTYGLVRKRTAFFVGVFLVLTILLTAFTFWLATGPRSITYVSNKIEALLDSISSEYDFQVGDTFLRLRTSGGGLVFEVNDLKVKEKINNEIIASIPEIEVKLDMNSLLYGDLIIRDIVVKKSNLNFSIYNNLLLSSGENDKPKKYNKFLAELIFYFNNVNEIPIKKINILGTKINYHIRDKVRKIDLPYISFKVSKNGSVLSFKSESKIVYNNEDIIFNINGGFEESSGIYVQSSFYNLETEHVVDFIPELSWLEQVKQDMDGEVRVNINKNGNCNDILFSLKTLKNQKEDIFVNGKVNFGFDSIEKISKFSDIFISIDVVNFEVNKLYKYWGEQFVPKTRNWVVDNIRGGIVPRASLKLTVTEEDILRGRIEGNSLYADVNIKNTSLEIPQSKFKIDDIDGKIIFTSEKMDFKLDKGRFLSSDLKKGGVVISDINDSNKVAIKINGQLYGDVSNLIKISEFYSNQDISVQKKSSITSGNAITNFSIDFPLGSKFSPDQIVVEGSSTISDFKFNDKKRKLEIDDGDFIAVFHNNELNVHGYGNLNEIYSHMDFNGTSLANSFSINFDATKEEIDNSEFSFLPITGGKVNVLLKGEIKGELESLDGKVDLSKAIIEMPYLNYKNSENQESILEFKFNKKSKVNNLKLNYISDDMNFSGNARINVNNFEMESMNLPVVKIGKDTDMNLNIVKDKANVYDIKIGGKSIDLSNLFEINSSDVANYGGSNSEKSNIADFNLVASLDRVVGRHDIDFSDAKIQLSCAKDYCGKIRFRSSLLSDNSNVVLDYMPVSAEENIGIDGTVRVLSLKSNNAGLFLDATGINERVIDGKITMSSVTTGDNYDFRDGKIIMKEFKVVKAVLLGKLLNIISIDILDLLQGAGVNFKKMSGRFSYVDKVLTISGLRAKGTSLGISADGSVDMRNNKYDLDGAIVPAYFINSLPGRIPLLGSIIVGKEGEGVIASRYIVRGDYNDPTIIVNPLSMLTPGFLRNIWGGKSEKEMDKKMQE